MKKCYCTNCDKITEHKRIFQWHKKENGWNITYFKYKCLVCFVCIRDLAIATEA